MRRPSRLTVLTATLVVLLPALAVLQYRWVGQLGDAARERMQRNLHTAAQQFRDAFDGEIARVLVSLQADSGLANDRYAQRYGAWASTTAYPWLVANVYVIDAPARDLRLHRWDGRAQAFVPAAWDGPLETARADFAAALAAFATGERRLPERMPLRDEDEWLVAPLVQVQFSPGSNPAVTSIARVFGFTVIQLNLLAIREQLLPALAQRHFSQPDDEGYRVAVVGASNPANVVYKSTPDAPTEPARADVNIPLFGGHRDPMLFLARGPLHDVGDKRNLFVSVIREQRDGRTTTRIASIQDGRWRLLAQHGRGSLDAAVGNVRRRNLFISFGILLLMGVSVGLLTLSSRRAQQLAQQRMEFVAGVSHELRTPVAVIHSAAENLSQGVVGDPDRVRRYGEAIEIEARRLGEMIERVLHFAGIESGRIVRAPLAIQPLIHQAIDAALPQQGEPFTVEREIPSNLPLVLGDATAIRSAIQNLVANAIKYGGPDRWIRVRAEAGPEVRESFMMVIDDRRRMLVLPRERGTRIPDVRITVEDHGRGIAPADLPHIFEPFYRGSDARARQTQGNGLGLALVRAVVTTHGGRVGVVTREGAGSAFTLHLPAAPATHEKPVPVHSPNEAAAG